MDSIMSLFWVLVQAMTLTTQVGASRLNHLAKPELVWNQGIQSDPGNKNVVQISPDGKWLYVTSRDGKLSKLDPSNGNYVGVYTPEKRREDGSGGTIPEDAEFQWRQYSGEGGISFHMDGDDSYFLYTVLDVPPASYKPDSRVIAFRHDASEGFNMLWEKTLSGTISGTPLIGSDGKLIYFTMNSYPEPPAPISQPAPSPISSPIATNSPVSRSPTASPAASTIAEPPATDAPTGSPVANALVSTPDAMNSTLANSTATVAPTALVSTPDAVNSTLANSTFTVAPTVSPTANSTLQPETERRLERESQLTDESDLGLGRDLRTDRGRYGRFIMLSHPSSGQLVYEFDSRGEWRIQNLNFAPAGIAHRPQYGNYAGGEGNTNDVVVWGSRSLAGSDPRKGDTLLFQLPKEFNEFNSSSIDTSEFETRILESVSWTTSAKPTFSASGLDLYFVIGGNRFVGWNADQKFDKVANLGPMQLIPAVGDDVASGQAAVLTHDENLLLISSTNFDYLFGVDPETGGFDWVLDGLGTDSIISAIKLSPSGSIAYFGKKNSVHAVEVTNKTLLWGENGYRHPSTTPSDLPLQADFSVSPTGEYIFYARSGSAISAIRVAEMIPTEEPTSSPSVMPSRITSVPSSTPSLASSPPPSGSTVPSMSVGPTVTPVPSMDPDFIYPSSSPTSTVFPTALPSASSTGTPSITHSHTPSSAPSVATSSPVATSPIMTSFVTKSPITASPVASYSTATEEATSKNPSPNPTRIPTNIEKPSATADLANNAKDEDQPSSSNSSIIGIAIGGGVGFLLLLGIIFYYCKKRGGEDDGVDTDWQESHTAEGQNTGGREDRRTFQYGDTEADKGDQKRWGEGELRW